MTEITQKNPSDSVRDGGWGHSKVPHFAAKKCSYTSLRAWYDVRAPVYNEDRPLR